MSGRAKRATTSTSKYEEVDSDVDMNEEDKEISSALKATRGSSSAFGPAKKAKKSKKKAGKSSKSAAKGALSLFPGMPLDVISEVFSRLHLRDILQISRVSKTFRSLLVSELKGSWTAARKRLNLPLPVGMTESFLAYLLYGTECFLCDRECGHSRYGIPFALSSRTRTCKRCYNTAYIRSTPRVLKQMTGLHVDAAKCTPHVGMIDPFRSFRYFTFDSVILELDQYMDSVSDELRALESGAGDVVAQKQSRDSRMARRSMAIADGGRATEDPVIAAYVAEKQAWIIKTHSESAALYKAYTEARSVEEEEEWEETVRLGAFRNGRLIAMRAKGVEIGYTQADMDFFDSPQGTPQDLKWQRFSFSEEEWVARRQEIHH